MINIQTILSSFDDKETLLQWLKKVESALAESVLVNVTVERSGNVMKLVFHFKDETTIETPEITLPKGDKGDPGEKGEKGDTGAVDMTGLLQVLEGSSSIVVDASETGDKVIIKLDEDYISAIESAIHEITSSTGEIVVTATEGGVNLTLSAVLSAKINRALTLPLTAPLSTELVGVGTDYSQKRIGVGENLEIINGVLKLKSELRNIDDIRHDEALSLEVGNGGEMYIGEEFPNTIFIGNEGSETYMKGKVFLNGEEIRTSENYELIEEITLDENSQEIVSSDFDKPMKKIMFIVNIPAQSSADTPNALFFRYSVNATSSPNQAASYISAPCYTAYNSYIQCELEIINKKLSKCFIGRDQPNRPTQSVYSLLKTLNDVDAIYKCSIGASANHYFPAGTIVEIYGISA